MSCPLPRARSEPNLCGSHCMTAATPWQALHKRQGGPSGRLFFDALMPQRQVHKGTMQHATPTGATAGACKTSRPAGPYGLFQQLKRPGLQAETACFAGWNGLLCQPVDNQQLSQAVHFAAKDANDAATICLTTGRHQASLLIAHSCRPCRLRHRRRRGGPRHIMAEWRKKGWTQKDKKSFENLHEDRIARPHAIWR